MSLNDVDWEASEVKAVLLGQWPRGGTWPPTTHTLKGLLHWREERGFNNEVWHPYLVFKNKES